MHKPNFISILLIVMPKLLDVQLYFLSSAIECYSTESFMYFHFILYSTKLSTFYVLYSIKLSAFYLYVIKDDFSILHNVCMLPVVDLMYFIYVILLFFYHLIMFCTCARFYKVVYKEHIFLLLSLSFESSYCAQHSINV